MGYIYKITNRKSGKIYIGKTTHNNPITRWKKHIASFKETKGGCPALRDAVRAYGIDAFMFEVLIICFDEDCNRWEREYIKKFDCMVPNGYNILEGGQGGAGFRGKTHSEDTRERLRETSKAYFMNAENVERVRENARKYYNSIDRKEFGKKITGSEKYKKALEEGRVGGRAHKDEKLHEEHKDKIRKGVLKYYEDVNECNIEKHRKAMAKATGRKVDQFDKDGNFIKTYFSIAEAARETNVKQGSIQFVLKGQYKTGGGFVWKYHIDKESKMENEIIYDS
jgi:group I intron endonuclease